MSESNKQNLEDASKDRQVIRKFLKKVGLSQNIDVLRGLSREERIEAQANRIEDAIKNETNETEKNKLQRILNSYKAVNETIGEFIKQNPITVKNKISNFGEVKKVYKKEIKKNEESKKEKVADVFEGENKQAFLRAQELKQSEDQIDISLNRAHLEITQGLPGSEEYFDDLLKDQSKVKEEIKNLEDTNYIEMRSAQLLSLREDLEKEGHIARVDSTKKDISFINEALLTGNPVFLHGPTGTGKTSLARFSAKELTGHKPYMIYCNPQTKESNIFGRQSIDVENGASKTYFDLGPLAKAMKDGKVCIFDEFSSLPKEQMSMIKGLLNHKVGDDVDIPGNGFVRIKQGFQIIYTANLKSDKNKERNDLPPEVANESAILNKEIKCQSPEEGYDIFLTRIMNDKGEASFSKYDLEDTIPSFLNAMKDIQEAYQGISSREFIESIGVQDAGSSKITSLKKFVLNQRSISQILNIWSVRSKRDKNLSFVEFLDKSLVNALNFGEYKEDKLLATKILVNRGLLSTVEAQDIGLTEDDLSIGARSEQRNKENLNKNILNSKNREKLSIKDLAELDPFQIKKSKTKNDLAEGFVDEKGEKVEVKTNEKVVPENQFSSLASYEKLKKSGYLDSTFDNKDAHFLNIAPLSKAEALKKYKESGGSTWIWEKLEKEMPYTTPTRKPLNVNILSFGKNISSEDAIKEMDKLGVRPLTYEELIQFGITYPEFQKKSPLIALGSKHVLNGNLRVPRLDWYGDDRNLRADYWDGGWDDSYRFPVVSK